MAITSEKRVDTMREFQRHESDTGSSEVQIALQTQEINSLTEHCKIHKKDHSSRRGLLKLVSRRRKLVNYLKRKDPQKCMELTKKLGIRTKY